MGRRRHVYVVIAGAALSFSVIGQLGAQVPTHPGGHPGGPVGAVPGGGNARVQAQPNLRMPDRLGNMSPEDRQRFQNNIERWRSLPPEARRELREREGWRQERLKRDAEAALRESGLQLEAERRAQYELRYMQERKRIEQALREELREKRQREMAPVVERLKKEFTQPQGATNSSATTTPAASPGK